MTGHDNLWRRGERRKEKGGRRKKRMLRVYMENVGFGI